MNQIHASFAGLAVLQLGQRKPAGFCAKLLADLGASVTRLVTADDPLNADGPFHPDDIDRAAGGAALYLDRAKTILHAADLDAAARSACMAAAAVIIVDEECAVLPPASIGDGQILCSITPFGQTGRYAAYAASHLNLFHASCEGGALQLPGRGWPPVQLGGEIGFYDAGCHAATLIGAAAFARRDTPGGLRIDVSNHDVMVSVNRTTMLRYLHDGIDCRYAAPSYHDMIYATADGHVVIVLAMQEKAMRALAASPEGQAFGDPDFADGGWRQGRGRHAFLAALTSWCRQRSTAQVERVLAAAGLAVGAVKGPAELLASPQMAHRGFFVTAKHAFAGEVALAGLPFRMTAAAPAAVARERTRAPAAAGGVATPPLAGVRVLDLSWAAAVPYATRILAALGAEIIKVEHRDRPDSARRGFAPPMHLQTERWPYGSMEQSPNFNDLAASKRSVSLDLRHRGAAAWIDRLLPECDVFVSNFRPGVIAKLGLGAGRLLEAFPHLIVGEASANGSSGPDSRRAGYAFVFAATGGLSAQTGFADGPPMWATEAVDYRCAAMFALAMVAALAERERAGRGQFVDFACQEAIAALAPDALLRHALEAPALGRMGNHHHRHAPHNVYPSRGADVWLTIAVERDEEWRALCGVMERPDLASRYPGAAARKACEIDIDQEIWRWAAFQDAGELAARLQQAGVRALPCLSNRDLAHSIHMADRAMLPQVEHPVMGRQTIVGMPWRMTPDLSVPPAPAPLMGEADGYVVAEIFGASAAAAARLREPMA